ncbi:MAG: hypothetical protein QOH71_4596 [Blastocatellia bacterium]|jgi:hypothetical protein|nr:hypothetical protein [Blastocatellia bacterium]
MAKPPFRYKPNKPATSRGIDEIQTVGSEEIPATYSDVFVVTNEAGTGVASIYFYQKTLPDRTAVFGGTEEGIRIPRAKCVSRIVMSPQSTDKLLEALAKNRGFTIARIDGAETDNAEEQG